jgi:hypothetical protein
VRAVAETYVSGQLPESTRVRLPGRTTIVAGIRDAVRGAGGRPPYLLPVVGEPGQTALFTGPEVKAALAANGVEGSLWRNQFAPRFVFALPGYAPGKLAERLGMPLLVCVADRDRETPANFEAWVAIFRLPDGRSPRPGLGGLPVTPSAARLVHGTAPGRREFPRHRSGPCRSRRSFRPSSRPVPDAKAVHDLIRRCHGPS